MIVKDALVYREDSGFIKEDIYIHEDRIVEKGLSKDQDLVIDAGGLYAIPGLTDIHFHGCHHNNISTEVVNKDNLSLHKQAGWGSSLHGFLSSSRSSHG